MTSAPAPPPVSAPEEAARAAQEALGAPAALAWPKPSPSARGRLAALLAALAGHAALLYALVREAPDPMAGAHGRLLDAVDITMVGSGAFEARQDVRAPPMPAAADAVAAKEGSVESDPASRRLEQEAAKREPEKAATAEVAEAPSVVTPQQELEKQPPQEREKPHEQQREHKEASAAADAGGAAARGDAPTEERRPAPAAASPGAVRAYAGYVQIALARAKPRRGFGYGTVRLKLLISPEGEIASLEVVKSSGSRRLDNAALEAVRRARFPRPPAGMTDRQRWYEFPVNFVR
jgi:protein TonB